MALPITAREELESRLDVLGRDATRYREEANEYRATARKLDEKAALHEERASELQGILDRAFPVGAPVTAQRLQGAIRISNRGGYRSAP